MKNITIVIQVSQGDYPHTQSLPELTRTFIFTDKLLENLSMKEPLTEDNITELLKLVIK